MELRLQISKTGQYLLEENFSVKAACNIVAINLLTKRYENTVNLQYRRAEPVNSAAAL